MPNAVNENTLKVLSYIISRSVNGKVSFLLEEVTRDLNINVDDVLTAVKELEGLNAVKVLSLPSTDLVLEDLTWELSHYDLQYILKKCDMFTYLKNIENATSLPQVKALPVEKSHLYVNLIELNEKNNEMKYILELLNAVTKSPAVWERNLAKTEFFPDLVTDFFDSLRYLSSFLKRLSIVGKRTLKYLQDLEKRQLEAKMSIASDVGRRRYETSREQFLNASTMFLMLAANLYTKEIYLDSKERICYNCKKTANITWKYCKFCGSELGNVFLPLKVIGSKLRLCPECGTTVEGEKNTCPKCGANLNKLGVDVGEISKNIEDIIKRIDAEVETLNARKVIERENAESIENEIRSLEEERKRLKDELEELKGHQEFEEEKIEYAVESGFLVVSTEELRVPHLYIAETLSKVKALCKQLKIEIDDGAQKSLISETISLERDVHEMMMKVVDSIPLALQEFDSFVINGNSLRCESCGTNNTKDASFCVGCGIAIRTRM